MLPYLPGQLTFPLSKTTGFYALPAPYSQLVTSLLISLKKKKKRENLRKVFSPSTTTALLSSALPPLTWDGNESPMSLSDVKPSTMCWIPSSHSYAKTSLSELSPLSSASSVFFLYCHSNQYMNMLQYFPVLMLLN